jgi:hypothetical protein
MYYILVRVWTGFAFGLSLLLGYVLANLGETLAEVSLLLGCGMGVLLWVAGVVLLAAILRPKRAPDFYPQRRPRLNFRFPI